MLQCARDVRIQMKITKTLFKSEVSKLKISLHKLQMKSDLIIDFLNFKSSKIFYSFWFASSLISMEVLFQSRCPEFSKTINNSYSYFR